MKNFDPDFTEIYDNFFTNEVLENSALPKRSRILISLASLITNHSINQYKEIANKVLKSEITPIELKEVLYQTVPYIGLGKAYDFFNVTNDVLIDNDIDLPLESQKTTNFENRIEKGREIQDRFFGKENMDEMRNNALEDQKHFNTFLEGYCFGDFYTRKSLNDQDRELITFSIIASLGGCENQLRGHVGGNLAVGNNKEILISALTILMPYIGFPRTLNALNIINEVCD
ncbi:carboxymuconolactone decarboxylase family protein [uncultured Methanobrevibacter sp.]|uniref:carboxymuconolactone decarboxylase family protein n=1 Tax=uncultured Methanobrevibacter sp. TaxID=253161 RepID=UPI002601778C|nr:carboxymuconolactone decarboxylase family protein [uncultured Methanobrevibacter sp.]